MSSERYGGEDPRALEFDDRKSPPAVAVQLSHELEWDPPHALSGARRWTCKKCGATVINYQGNVYGSATENGCDEYKAQMKRLLGGR